MKTYSHQGHKDSSTLLKERKKIRGRFEGEPYGMDQRLGSQTEITQEMD